MRTKAGALNQRIRIESETRTTNPESGADVVGWATFADQVPCELVPLSGREFMASGARQGETIARGTIRTLAGVDDTMRIVHLGVGTIYAIHAVLPDPTFRDHLTLMLGAGVSSGE